MENLSDYDRLLVETINKFNLNTNNTTQLYCDRKHYLCLWWLDYKRQMTYYNKETRFAEILNLDRTTIYNYLNKRKKTYNYNNNILLLKRFLLDESRYYKIIN